MASEQAWWVYVLECRGGRLYTGISPDVEARLEKHREGKGATFTRLNPPLRVLGAKEFPNRSAAAKEEARLKRMSRFFRLEWAQANGLTKR